MEDIIAQMYFISIVHAWLSPAGPVAVKKLNVTNPTEQQLLAFKNEVGVLRYVCKHASMS